MKKYTKKTSPRHQARRFAMQALYQWHHAKHSVEEIFIHFSEEKDWPRTDQQYFQELVRGCISHIADIDQTFSRYIDRDKNDINPVELAVLRVACYELMFQPSVPYRVIINEALEITKRYGSDQGYKYINGVLDSLALEVRKVEVEARNDK